MFEVNVNGRKQRYRSKPTMNVDTTGSSASIPKPLTYDYMPEGYPSKSVETVTLMEEQEVAFSEQGGKMTAISPVALDIKQGDNLTVVWDGVSYDVTVKTPEGAPPGILVFGNIGLIGIGYTEDYPFFYTMTGSTEKWITADTATTHTIKVMRQQETYTPIDVNYMPEGYPKKNVKIDTFEEQEVTFSDADGVMGAQVSIGFEIVQGDKLTVVWDGANYDVIVKKITVGPEEYLAFGNLGLLGDGETTDYPFAYRNRWWFTADTATSHTIKVTRQQENITPMSTDFVPKNLNVVFRATSSIAVPTSCNVTYGELRGWLESNIPVLAVLNIGNNHEVYILGHILIGEGYIRFGENSSGSGLFKYNSDGIFSTVVES